jgi:hypothetical protein
MAKYVSTGKVNVLRSIGGLAFGVTFSLLIGLSYAWAMDTIPFIIVQVIVFALAIGLVLVFSIPMVHIGWIRNKIVKAIFVFIICMVAWYSQWVYFTQPTFWTSLFEFKHVFRDILAWSDTREITITRHFSSDGPGISGIGIVIMDALEFLCFMLPVFFATKFSKDYFCEDCKAFYLDKKRFVREMDEAKILSGEASGDFRFISTLQFSKSVSGPPGPAWKIDYSYCKKCNQSGAINISRGFVKFDKKQNPVFSEEQKLTSDTILSTASIAELQNTAG